MNILFVSIAFPPKNNPECLQTGKYFKYLSKNGQNKIAVLTSASPTLFMPYDATLEKMIAPGTQLFQIPIPENKYLNFLIRKVNPAWLQLPDTKFLFHWQWKKAAKRIKQAPDVIYSRASPLSSVIMALRLVKKYKRPWVLHLSDPWVDNPLEHRAPSALKKNQQWEQECFSLAQYITLTSAKTVAFYKQKYPQWGDKFVLMPNVYDPADVRTESTCIDPTAPLHFVYTGGLTDTRTPEPLFKAVQLLAHEDAALLSNVVFSFAGQFDRKNNALFAKYDLSCVKNLGLLSYTDAQKLQQAAHVLLAIDSPAISEEKALFFPSKLLDYIASGKKMIAITDTNSTTYEVVENKYGDCVAHEEIKKLAGVIKKYSRAYRYGNAAFFSTQLQDEIYSAAYNAQRLQALFADAVIQHRKM